jgi:hypothetical protein
VLTTQHSFFTELSPFIFTHMKHTLLLFLSLLVSTPFVSCGSKKGSDPEPVDPKTALLINKEWRCTADVIVGTNSSGASVNIDRYKDYPACQKDDFIRFNDDFTLLISEGPGKCAPNDPQTATGKWSWNADKTIITFTEPSLDFGNLGPELSGPADLTSTSFSVRQPFVRNGITGVRTVTYGSI